MILIIDLPNDILNHIKYFLTSSSIVILFDVNKLFRRLVFGSSLLSEDVMDDAISTHSVKLCDYLVSQLTSDFNKWGSRAVFKGSLVILKWACENGCQWNRNICPEAAYGGHLDILKWVRENGCEWNSDTCSKAAYGGHLDILKWAGAST